MAAPETVGAAADPLAAPALELAAAVRRREVSPTELVEASLARIAAVDGKLGAFVTVDEDGARAGARRAEEALASGAPVGPLHGVPIAIKDLTPTAGLRTTFGSRAFADHVPAADAASVARIRAAGMPIVGKTSLCEFGALPLTESLLTGPCRNPWSSADNAGGSSGGAACAVVAGMVPLAHGTDGGGSVRIPAALCGAFGLKPSRGRISLAPNAGERLLGWATEGPIARTVADGAALLDTMAGNELGDPYGLPAPERSFREEVDADPGRLRIGVALSPPGGGPVDPELVAATTAVADRLEELGHRVDEASPLWEGGDPGDVLLVWSTLSAYYRTVDLELVEPATAAMARRGAATSALEYVEATVRLQQLARRVAGFWAAFDVLLSPVTPLASVPNRDGDPLPVELIAALTSFTRWANLTGQPAASLPVPDGESRPLAVQLIGSSAGEATLLRLCGQLERSLAAQ